MKMSINILSPHPVYADKNLITGNVLVWGRFDWTPFHAGWYLAQFGIELEVYLYFRILQLFFICLVAFVASTLI